MSYVVAAVATILLAMGALGPIWRRGPADVRPGHVGGAVPRGEPPGA